MSETEKEQAKAHAELIGPHVPHEADNLSNFLHHFAFDWEDLQFRSDPINL